MITEWTDLEGRTIVKVREFFLGGCVLSFEDGEVAYIAGAGEERHGAHWPVLSNDYEDLVKEVLK